MQATLGAAVGPLSTFYRVPFEEVCDLVRSRRVYLVKGQAYVPQESLASLVVGIFRSRLSKALAVTARQWSAKLAPMVRHPGLSTARQGWPSPMANHMVRR